MSDPYVPRLRVLLDPVYISAANLGGSSTYRRFAMLARELVNRGHFVYWQIPDREEYQADPIENHPNVGVIRTSYIQDQFVADGVISSDFVNLFGRVAGKYHIDVICTCRNSLAAMYKRLAEPPRFHDVKTAFTDKGYGVPVVIIEDFVQTRKEQHVSESYWLAQVMGYLLSDLTVFPSIHNQNSVTKEMLDYIVMSKVKNFTDNKATVLPVGVSCGELDTLYDAERWKAENGFRVVSIGRIFGVSYIEYLPWFDYLFKSGISDVELTVSLSGALGGPMRNKLSKIGFDFSNLGKQFRILENNNRSNYIRQLRGYHAFICPMSHIDHPAGLFEAMYMGVPGVMPVSDYQQSFFKDYPFVIDPKDKAGFISTLMWIREHREEARNLVLPWREIIRERYNADSNTPALADRVETIARGYVDRFKTSSAVIKFCQELKGKSYTFADVVAFLQKQGYMGVSVGDMGIRSTFTYARGAVHNAMLRSGFVDSCASPDELFVRRDVFERTVAAGSDQRPPKPNVRPVKRVQVPARRSTQGS